MMYWDEIHAQHERVRFATTDLKITPSRQKTATQKPSVTDSRKSKDSKPTIRRAAPTEPPFAIAFPKFELPKVPVPEIALPKVSLLGKLAIMTVSAGIVFLFALMSFGSWAASADEGKTGFFPNSFMVTKPLAENADELQFSQDGEYWKVLGYWNANVGYAGCGLCSYTSAIDIVTGNSYTPTDMLVMRGDWAGMDNWIDDDTGLDGQTHRQFTYDNFSVASRNVDVNMDSLIEALDENAVCVICTGGPVFYDIYGNLYNYPGHFVCVYRYDNDTGIFHVHDSAVEHYLGANVEYETWQMEDMVNYTSSIVAYRAV